MIIFGRVIRKVKTDIDMNEFTTKATASFVRAWASFHYHMEDNARRHSATRALSCLEELREWNPFAYRCLANEGYKEEIQEMKTWLKEHPAE